MPLRFTSLTSVPADPVIEVMTMRAGNRRTLPVRLLIAIRHYTCANRTKRCPQAAAKSDIEAVDNVIYTALEHYCHHLAARLIEATTAPIPATQT
jgi:hypothetical protein